METKTKSRACNGIESCNGPPTFDNNRLTSENHDLLENKCRNSSKKSEKPFRLLKTSVISDETYEALSSSKVKETDKTDEETNADNQLKVGDIAGCKNGEKEQDTFGLEENEESLSIQNVRNSEGTTLGNEGGNAEATNFEIVNIEEVAESHEEARPNNSGMVLKKEGAENETENVDSDAVDTEYGGETESDGLGVENSREAEADKENEVRERENDDEYDEGSLKEDLGADERDEETEKESQSSQLEINEEFMEAKGDRTKRKLEETEEGKKRLKKDEQEKESETSEADSNTMDFVDEHTSDGKESTGNEEEREDFDMDSQSNGEMQRKQTIRNEFRRFLSRLRKQHITKLTRSDLEELAIQKFCEAMADRSDLGDLRRQNQKLLATVEAWNGKYKNLLKKFNDTQLVIKKFEFDMEKYFINKEGSPPVPPRVLRSVGLQVSLPIIPLNQSNSSIVTAPVTAKSPTVAVKQVIKPISPSSRVAPAILTQPPRPKVTSTVAKPPPRIAPAPMPRLKVRPLQQVNQMSRQPLQPPPLAIGGKPAVVAAPTATMVVRRATPQPIVLRNATPVAVAAATGVTPPRVVNKVVYLGQSTPLQNSGNKEKPTDSSDVIDLTDEEDKTSNVGTAASAPTRQSNSTSTVYIIPKTTSAVTVKQIPVSPAGNIQLRPTTKSAELKHPAPLPGPDFFFHSSDPKWKDVPPPPALSVAKSSTGVFLSWTLPHKSNASKVSKYQLYAYPEGFQEPHVSLWKKVGDIDPLPLPMSCTLTNFNTGRTYHFAMRALDVNGRTGRFSMVRSINL